MTTTTERPPVEEAPPPAPPAPPPGPGPRRPRPPRKMPRSLAPKAPLSTGQRVARGVAALVAAILLTFAVYLTGFSQLQHLVTQQRLDTAFRDQLAAGTAPVSEGTFDGILLADGAPVARLQIPAIGVDEIVVEGTTSGVLMGGPGHRRDTVLPGQLGVAVLMGRAAAFGGPFGRLQELPPGATLTVTTGQGKQTFEVMGLRYAGDPSPPRLTSGEARLVLETARGPAYLPQGVVRLDARLTSDVQDPGARQTRTATLPPASKELAGDSSTTWALLFTLQLLVIVEVGAVWATRRVGARQAWIVFVPLTLLAALLVADQGARLLPNLL
ncbi:sortase [Cellulomonas sp. P5_C6]